MKKVTELFLVIIISLLSSCSFITGQTPESATTPPPAASVTKPPVYVTIPDPNGPKVIDISQLPILINVSTIPVHLLGERIILEVGISKLTSDVITVDPFPPAMRITSFDSNELVYHEPAGNRTCVFSKEIVPFYTNEDSWDQKNDNGQQVPPGLYEISYEYVIIDRTTLKTYSENAATIFRIIDPANAMTKDISVNQTVTDSGLGVTLKRLELNAVGGTAYVFYNPPGYTAPDGKDPNQFTKVNKFFHGEAEYRIDGGETKTIKNSGVEGNTSGITLKFKNIEPVPLDAGEFILTVTNLGGTEGRWEFRVPLE